MSDEKNKLHPAFARCAQALNRSNRHHDLMAHAQKALKAIANADGFIAGELAQQPFSRCTPESLQSHCLIKALALTFKHVSNPQGTRTSSISRSRRGDACATKAA